MTQKPILSETYTQASNTMDVCGTYLHPATKAETLDIANILDVPEDMEVDDIQAAAVDRWYKESGLGPMPLKLSAAMTTDVCAQWAPRVFDENMITFSDWLFQAASSWESPTDYLSYNAEFVIRLQPFLKDYRKNFNIVSGSRLKRRQKRLNLVLPIRSLTRAYFLRHFNMPSMAVKGRRGDLLHRLYEFPMLSEFPCQILWTLPAGMDYIANALYALIEAICDSTRDEEVNPPGLIFFFRG